MLNLNSNASDPRWQSSGILVTLVLLALATSAYAVGRGTNLVANGGFETPGGWSAVGGGFQIDTAVSHSGRQSLRCRSERLEDTHGAKQVITLDPPIRHPFRISAWSRAEHAEVGQDYDLYLDLFYADGTPLWGQIAHFQPGTHDWQKAELSFEVAKPVKRIEVHLLFRQARGTVWFDDVEVSLEPFVFTKFQLLPDLFGPASLALVGNSSLPAQWDVFLERPGGMRLRQSGTNGPIRALWNDLPIDTSAASNAASFQLRVSATDLALGETIVSQHTVPIKTKGQRAQYLLWTESSMQRVLPQAFPTAFPLETSYQLSLAGGEYESFQIIALAPPQESLKHVEIQISDLVSPENHHRIAATNIQWHQVGYVKVDHPMKHPASPEAVGGWWPDPLLPVREFDVPPAFAQPIWVTVYAPPGTPAGNYTGSIVVSPRGAEAKTIAVTASVYGFTLPKQGHLKTAFALMDGFLERVYDTPLTPELRQRYGDYVLAHRLNPDDISRTSPPALEDLKHYRDRGLNAFNALNMVEERGRNTWVCFSDLGTYTPQFKERLIARLDPYLDALRREGLANQAYIYTFDERGREFFPVIREYFGMVKQHYPEVHTLTTAYVPQDPKTMRDLNVDWNCPVSSVYRFEAAERCRAEGLQVWSYICCGPRYPFANWMADDPLIEARVIWWQAYHQKMDGFLYWGLNIWDLPNNNTPIAPERGPFLDWSIFSADQFYGDGRLLYPGKDGPIGSIRLANIRDGLEDYEYLWLLAEKSGNRETARQACPPVTQSMTEFTRDPAIVRAERDRVARRIVSLLDSSASHTDH